ncbi:MAG: hypothetical protein ACI8PZ_006544 [Myxococcota bacterium]|jgi:hypothetical protein
MTRLDRRLASLRGKRNGCFDTDQYYVEQAARARVGRRLRFHLRRDQPVMLVAPRWSQAHRFLDDLSVDLGIGKPGIIARPLSLAPLAGRTVHQAWAWLVQALSEFGAVPLEGPAWQAVNSRGFRHVMGDHLRRIDDGTRRCLLMHGLEHAPMEAVTDLIQVFEAHSVAMGNKRRFNLLLCGSVDSAHIDFDATERLLLPDFGDEEALDSLIEHLGPTESATLREAIAIVGGVPAILDTLGGETLSVVREIVENRDSVWRLLGKLAAEIRGAIEIAIGDEALALRLELLASEGPQTDTHEVDDTLIRAGIALRDPRTSSLQVRAPMFSDLALAS